MFAVVAIALCLNLGQIAQADTQQCKTVRMGLVNWTDVIATSAITQVMLQGLGYETRETSASQQIIVAGLADRNLDVFLGYWQPTMIPVVKPYLDKGAIKALSPPLLDDAQSTYAVPAYAYEGGLRTFSDIARFRDKLGGKIYGIEPGSGHNRETHRLIEADRFGLGDFQLIESSESGMLAAVRRAVARKQWILFFGWKPHPMNLQINMRYLSGSQEVFGGNEGLATVSPLVVEGYDQTCPNVTRLVGNLRFSSNELSEAMAPILGHEQPMDVAKAWLKPSWQGLRR